MHNSSFDTPNQQEAQEHSEEPNLRTREGLEAGELGLKAREFNFEAGEENTEARACNFEAKNTNIPTPVLNPEKTYGDYHLELNRQICDKHGQSLHSNALPPPFTSREHKFLFMKNQMSSSDIDKLMYLWGQTLAHHGDTPPFTNHKDLYSTIDVIPLEEVMCESFTMKFNGEGSVPSDSDLEYVESFALPSLLHLGLLSSRMKSKGDSTKSEGQLYTQHGVTKYQEILPPTRSYGAVAILLVNGNNELHTSGVRQDRTGHRMDEYTQSPTSPKDHSLYQDPHVMVHNMFANRDFKDEIEYMPYREWKCAKCFAFPAELDGEDVQLHAQIITDVLCDNGVDANIVSMFKDHLVIWVKKYLECIHGKTRAKVVMDDIDRRLVSLELLQHHHFQTFDIITEDTLEEIKEALDHFHCYRKIFQETSYSLMHYVMLIHMFSTPNDFMAHGMLGPHSDISQQDPSHNNRNMEDSGKANDSGEVDNDSKMNNSGKVDNGGETDERGKEDENDKEDDGAIEGAQNANKYTPFMHW
ncbi:hypothetical protein BDR05DRAFT_948157 [Suillus weaverae]|nr:hypothetical protein BDR05DRAFT_948157 [Suillus weaverae]